MRVPTYIPSPAQPSASRPLPEGEVRNTNSIADTARATQYHRAVVLAVFRLACVCSFFASSVASARLPSDAPPLPDPASQGYDVINVGTAQELADACWNLTSNQAIVIAPGRYELGSVNFPNGVDGRLTVGRFGASPISNILIRGSTNDPRDVEIVGDGMLDTTVPFGFQVFTATDVTIANLSVSNVYYHAIAFQGDQGAERIGLYGLRLYDAGQQIVKSSGAGVDGVTIEYSELFFTNGAVVHPEGSPPNTCYTNAIDALGVDDWVIRHNWIHDLRCANGELAGPSILIWRNSADTLVDSNLITNSSRGVYLGFESSDHRGGVVQNNMIRWEPNAGYAVDVGIYTPAPGSLILHNTVVTNDEYPNAIEVRYSSATNVEVVGNLVHGAIAMRNGATAEMIDNVDVSASAWFVDESTGDLRLTSLATPAIDASASPRSPATDFSGQIRDSAPDAGADEFDLADVIFLSGFED